MGEFEVWAPDAQRVDLYTQERTLPMAPSPDGWWRCRIEACHGARYGYSVDGGPARPDPRSPSQPEGIDGLSEWIDHTTFPWSDTAWRGIPLAGSIIYELHVGTFTSAGTFDAIIERLSHLVALGIDAVELLPVAEFSGDRGWGYDGADLYAPHHRYGGPDGLKRLVDACHAHGLGVILDVVYNHLGPAGNYLGEFGPYFSDRHQTNWGDAINFDGPGSDEVRRFVIDNALMWLRDYHVDGLRLDAVHAFVDESACHVLEQLATETEALAAHLRRPLFLIAESDLNEPRFVRSRDGGGMGIDSAWADEWHHALHAALTGERSGYYEDFGSLDLLAKALRQAWVYDGTWSEHRKRHHGRAPRGLRGHQFVVCAQNHDQIGNRALGERSSALMSNDRLRIAAALLLAAPFVPMLFQGEEWGASSPFQYFTDHRDPALGEAVSEGRRGEFAHFGWDPEQVPDPQSEATFLRSKLDWDELEEDPHVGLLAWHRDLIAMRRSFPSLSDPRLETIEVEVDDGLRSLTIRRGTVSLLVNLGERDALFVVSPGATLLLKSRADICLDGGVVAVPPDSVAILEVACG
jgi:maltooligosyltrehalose trehalohydrolase